MGLCCSAGTSSMLARAFDEKTALGGSSACTSSATARSAEPRSMTPRRMRSLEVGNPARRSERRYSPRRERVVGRSRRSPTKAILRWPCSWKWDMAIRVPAASSCRIVSADSPVGGRSTNTTGTAGASSDRYD